MPNAFVKIKDNVPSRTITNSNDFAVGLSINNVKVTPITDIQLNHNNGALNYQNPRQTLSDIKTNN